MDTKWIPADTIHSHVRIKFDWRDRLKILLRGDASVSLQIETEHLPGMLRSSSEVVVPPLFRSAGGPMFKEESHHA